MITKFALEFGNKYCDNDGNILWHRIVELNSGTKS